MKRDTRLILLATVITVFSAGAVGLHLATATPPPVRTVSAEAVSGPDERFTLQFVGDTFLGDRAEPYIHRYGYDWPFRRLKGALDGDFTIANAEAVITATQVPWNLGKEYYYGSRPEALAAFDRAGIDAIGLANNHAMDGGPAGVRDSLRNAEQWGLPAFGAGRNLAQAERPLLVKTSQGTVAVVGLGENFGSAITADLDQAGTVRFEPESVQRGVDLARAAGADWVIGLVHWGDNYMPLNREQRHWARTMAQAGYDVIVGAGPHVVQPVEFIGDVPVVFSLGNFVFGSRGQYETYDQPGIGLILDVEFQRGEDPRLVLRCVRANNELVEYRPWMCGPKAARRELPKLYPSIRMRPDGSGVVLAEKAGQPG